MTCYAYIIIKVQPREIKPLSHPERLNPSLSLQGDHLRTLQQECDDLKRQRNAASSALMRQATGIEAERSASATHPTWQVQNRVGGGSLYGVADNSASAAAAAAAGGAATPSSRAVRTGSYGEASTGGGTIISRTSTGDVLSPTRPPLGRDGSNGSMSASSSHGSLAGTAAGAGAAASPAAAAAHGGRSKMEGVDIVYLKNVLLKFMEASVTGKVGVTLLQPLVLRPL